jgi:pyruvate/2-oxoglutarate dehydrogenase complex dihydrolipoamide acyltransferase (E2) component
MTFDAFKAEYLLEMSEMVAKKNPYVATAQPRLTSVDYDAAARLAYQASGKTVGFNDFRSQYLSETSAMVAKKNPYVTVSESKPTESTAQPGLTSVDYDAAARLEYQASGKTVGFNDFRSQYLSETSAMIAKKNPYVTMSESKSTVSTAHPGFTSVDYDAAARLAYQASAKTVEFNDFRSQYLSETSAMVAKKNPYIQGKPTPPTHEISARSFMKQPMIKVVTAPKPKSNLPPASPLARLLAQELGLELTKIGKGSGKNGKILIEDVRMFHSKMEEAKAVITKKQPYFATVNS